MTKRLLEQLKYTLLGWRRPSSKAEVDQDHESIETHSAATSLEALESFSFYHPAIELSEVIRWMGDRTRSGDYVEVSETITVLRGVHIARADETAQTLLLEWLEELVRTTTAQETQQVTACESDSTLACNLLASAIRLVKTIVPRSAFAPDFEHVLDEASRLKARRVVANSLEVLMHFRSESDRTFAIRLTHHDDNRIAANALIHQGSREIQSGIVKRLKWMLNSSEDRFVASGLYAVGELAALHQSRNPDRYRQHKDFIALTKRTSAFIYARDSMIRRQALIASRKCADPEVLNVIKSAALTDTSGSLLEEVEHHLPNLIGATTGGIHQSKAS